jgi:dihydroorotate dehydrogenase electron transfer subunit
VKINKSNYPLLRRPFSISNISENEMFIMFDVRGEGTELLAGKKIGEEVQILGALGNGFTIADDFETAIFIAGGIGSAPFPFLSNELKDKEIVTFVGARSEKDLIAEGLENVRISTDDGSAGFKGNVVEHFASEFSEIGGKRIKIFSCGPTPMLKGVQRFALENNLRCELSLESHMACGFGLCQGCPVEKADGSGYLLICKNGPVFDAKEIKL